jgi:hypothetical protein
MNLNSPPFRHPFSVDESEDQDAEFENEDELEEFLHSLEAQLDDQDHDEGDHQADTQSFNIWCCCHRVQLVLGDLLKKSDDFKGLRKICYLLLKFITFFSTLQLSNF